MIVLISGMPRSGSTFSFNMAREVLQARGTLQQIDRHPWLAAWRIARFLYPVGLSVSDGGVVDIGFSHCDRQTFFHRRHVTALQSRPAEQVLSGREIGPYPRGPGERYRRG